VASTRIGYNQGTPFGSKVAVAVRDIRDAQIQLKRAMEVANAITTGGTVPTSLEGSPEFGVSVGQGSAFYTELQSLIAAVFTTPSSWVAVQASIDMDQG
jgi:hypothetical protein